MSVAKCYIVPPKNYQKIHFKSKSLIIVEENTFIVDNTELPQYIAKEQEIYLYDTRKNPPVKSYNDASSDLVSVNESSDSDDDYIPLSEDEDFGEEMLHIFSQFDKYMKGPGRKVKGRSLCNAISNVRRSFVLVGVRDIAIPSTYSIPFLIIIIIIIIIT